MSSPDVQCRRAQHLPRLQAPEQVEVRQLAEFRRGTVTYSAAGGSREKTYRELEVYFGFVHRDVSTVRGWAPKGGLRFGFFSRTGKVQLCTSAGFAAARE